jgi:hypothetical protein
MTALATLLALAPLATQAIQIEYRNQTFVLRSGSSVLRVPLKELKKPTPKASLDRVVFRKDDAYAVWDSRGLTVRKGNRSLTTRYPEIALSPRMFTADEIHATRTLLALGARSLWASSIGGALRIGNRAYFLLQWRGLGDRPWLEALVSVDLAESSLRPLLHGRFEGTSLAPEDDPNGLTALGRQVVWLAQRTDRVWGRVTFSEESRQIEFKPMGKGLERHALHSATVGNFTEKTSYGSRLLGRMDLRFPATRHLMETRGSVHLLDEKHPWLALAHEENGLWLHNLESGAKLRAPESVGFRRNSFGLLVWSPSGRPRSAVLYDVNRFERLASWGSE